MVEHEDGVVGHGRFFHGVNAIFILCLETFWLGFQWENIRFHYFSLGIISFHELSLGKHLISLPFAEKTHFHCSS